MFDTRGPLTRARARAIASGNINEGLQAQVPVTGLEGSYSHNSDYSFLTAEEATAYRGRLPTGSYDIGYAFNKGVNHIEQIQSELVDALVNAYVSHMAARDAWLGTDIDVLREKQYDLIDDKLFLKEELYNVYNILGQNTGTLLIILNDINRQLNGVSDLNPDGTLNPTQIENVIRNVVNTHIPNTYLVTTAATQRGPMGGKKNRTHRNKHRTHRKKHRTHRKKHKKTRKN